jgi:ribosomal protein S14
MAKFIKINNEKHQRNKFNETVHRTLSLKKFLLKKKKTQKMHNLVTSFPIVRVKNRCILTGASKSVYAKFSLSRHALRKYFNFGYLPMIIPSSW